MKDFIKYLFLAEFSEEELEQYINSKLAKTIKRNG